MDAITFVLIARFLLPGGEVVTGLLLPWLSRARQAAAEGGKEIVLTGVNIGDFGKTTGESFFDLVKALDQVDGIERYRISSIEPNLLTDEIIEFVSRSLVLCLISIFLCSPVVMRFCN
jgi:hypothetical protein